MAEPPAFLMRDVGPLPMWGWLAAGVLGISGGLYLRSRRDGGVPAALPDDNPAVTYEPFGGYSGGAGAPGVSPPNQVSNKTEITTNSQWRAAAVALAKQNGYSAIAADRILSDYLEGIVKPDSTALLDIVIGSLGLPPSPPTILPDPLPDPPDGPIPPDDDPPHDPHRAIVRNAFIRILGYPSDYEPAAGDYWVQKLRSGELDESSLEWNLRNSQEARNLYRDPDGLEGPLGPRR